MPWSYGNPLGNAATFGTPPQLQTDPSVAPLANAIAALKYKQTQDVQKTLADSIQQMAADRAANAALETAGATEGLPAPGSLEGMGTAGYAAYGGKKGLAELVQDQQDAAARQAYWHGVSGTGFGEPTIKTIDGRQVIVNPSRVGPQIHALPQEKEDPLTVAKYNAFAKTEQELVKAAAKEAKQNQDMAAAHPGQGYENKPFSQAPQLAEVRKQMADLEKSQSSGGAGAGGGASGQYPVGTRVRTGEVWHTMTEQGWDPPL